MFFLYEEMETYVYGFNIILVQDLSIIVIDSIHYLLVNFWKMTYMIICNNLIIKYLYQY